VLVTGATGLVGANLVRALIDDGCEVRALVRETSDRRALVGLPVEEAVGDVLDPASLQAAARGCEVLYHAASIFSYWGHSAEDLHRTAVEGALHAIEAAHRAGVRRVVLTSSSVTLGSSLTTVARDEASPDEAGAALPEYYLSKIAQERTAFERARALGVELCAVCPGMVVGPHDYRLSPSNAIIAAYWEDPFGTTWPGGCNLVHAADVARGHVLVAERGAPGERYFLGSENWEWSLIHRTIAELSGLPAPRVHANHTASYLAAAAMELASGLTGKPPRNTRAQARAVGRFFWYRNDKARALGFAPRPARQALAETIAWLLVQSPHVSRELRSRLHPSIEVMRAREAFLSPRLRAGSSPASLGEDMQ
jgi:dihydroflavonol-4-reductase